MNVEIKLCPFCKKKAEMWTAEHVCNFTSFEVRCTDKECYLGEGAGYEFDSFKDAIEAWNRRIV